MLLWESKRRARAASVFLLICFISPILCGRVFALDYFLSQNDRLEVKIIGQKELDTKQAIAPDGTISLPLLGRVYAQGQTLNAFNDYLSAEFAKYIKDPQVLVYLTPRQTYVVQHNFKTKTWEVKEADSIAEARAYTGGNYIGEIRDGDIVSVEVGEKSEGWEANWYKITAGLAVAAGLYATFHK